MKQRCEIRACPADGATRAPKGSEAQFQRLRFFFSPSCARVRFCCGILVLFATVAIIALLAPWLAPYGPVTADPSVYLLPPGGGAIWLGTDGTGMDIFSRVLFAPREIDLAIAIVGTFHFSATIGGGLGALVGYYEGQQTWRRAVSTMVCALPMWSRRSRSSSLRDCAGRGVRAKCEEHYPSDRIREYADLPEADANSGSNDQTTALRRSCLRGGCFRSGDSAAARPQ